MTLTFLQCTCIIIIIYTYVLYKLTVVLSLLGWWFVEDKHGRAGWAPATYLGPVVDRAKQASNPSQNSIVGESEMNR